MEAWQKALSCEQLAAGLTGCSQVVIHAPGSPEWTTTASLSTLTSAWGLIQTSLWTWNKRDCPLSCQSWAVGAEGKFSVCNRVRSQLEISFNFKSMLRNSCFSFLADETKIASCQITFLQMWGLLWALSMFSAGTVKLLWLIHCAQQMLLHGQRGWCGNFKRLIDLDKYWGGSCSSQY